MKLETYLDVVVKVSHLQGYVQCLLDIGRGDTVSWDGIKCQVKSKERALRLILKKLNDKNEHTI